MGETNQPPKATGAGAGPGDPQMDDILASIRRILNEDEAAGAAAPGAGMDTPDATPAAAAPEPLELTEAMLVQPPAEPPAAVTPVVPVLALAPEPVPLSAQAPAVSSETLVAPAVAAATSAAMGQLLRTVVQERATMVSRGGPTLEDVVRETLRPLLKDWLDHHLPPLVERLVRAEIERVVGRALP